MIKDFFNGTTYVFKGCKAFYGDIKAWRYAAMPLGIMVLIYILAFWGIIHLAGMIADNINGIIVGLPDWIYSSVSGITYFLAVIIGIILLGTTICTVYEVLGGLFFDSLVGYYEQKRYGITPHKLSFSTTIKFCFDSIVFGLFCLFIFCALFIFSLSVPIIGQVVLIAGMGYYCGMSYMVSSSNNCGISIGELKRRAAQNVPAMMGFGITSYLLLLIPFAPLIILPGLVLGGAELFNNRLKNKEILL